MSCDVNVSLMRLKIDELTGSNGREAYLFFKDKIGEPDDFYDYGDDEVDFHYNGEKNYYDVKNFGQNWYADFVFHHSTDDHYSNDMCLTLAQLHVQAQSMAEKFGGKFEDVRVCSYTWYNGADEPEVY